MKLLLMILLGILALNALVILGVTGILFLDHLKSRRRAREKDAHAESS